MEGLPTVPRRLIVVSNRLPLSITRAEDKWAFKMSSGGLVAALTGMKNTMEFVWIGWPGAEFPEEEQKELQDQLWKEQRSVPVFISNEVTDLYYNGFSNEVIWPLFHYIVETSPFETRYWEAYKLANRAFADVVFKHYQEGDLIWVHDYHLMLLPLYLKKRIPDASVGFFLHIPFPTSEIFRTLPVREELLRGLLNADLVGFHTPDYLNHFCSATVQLLGVQATPTTIQYNAKTVSLGVFPVGIEPEKFFEALQTEAVHKEIEALKETLGVEKGKKVLLGVDRLDYIKGIPNKLVALERFLKQHPEWRDRVTMIQIAVPSRTDVPEYKRLTREVNEICGRINGLYGGLHHMPMLYLYQSVNFVQLCALYAVADAMVITSLRDGMNLVCYEYICAQRDRPEKGVLILSEFAGASHSLSGSVAINPHDTEGVVHAIHEALTMSIEEKADKFKELFDYVTFQTSARWGSSFVNALATAAVSNQNPNPKPTKKLDIMTVASAFKRSRRRKLIVLDDDGTVNPLSENYTFAKPPHSVLNALRKLGARDDTDVLIVSGRSRRVLSAWFQGCPVALCAEYGSFMRIDPKSAWERRVSEDYREKNVLDAAMPICVAFSERTPGSMIEEKELGLAWHYRTANPYFGRWQSRDLELHLTPLLARYGAEVIPSNGLLAIKPRDVSKGAAIRHFLEVMATNPPVRKRSSSIEFETPPLENFNLQCFTRTPELMSNSLSTSSIPASMAENREDASRSPSSSPNILQRLLMPYDFILCIGDDRDDEDMFTTLKEMLAFNAAEQQNNKGTPGGVPWSPERGKNSNIECFLVTVGKKISQANYWVDSPEKVRRLLFALNGGNPSEVFLR